MSAAVNEKAEALESLSWADVSECVESPVPNGPSEPPSYQQLAEHRVVHPSRVDATTTCPGNPEPSASSVFSSPISNLQLAEQREAEASERASPQGDSPTSPDALETHNHPEPPQLPSPYQQLDRHNREIRIMCLLPGRYKDPVRGYLEIANLDDNPHYEALSYVWGDPLIRETVYINKQPMNVTVNLFLALRRLRHRRRLRCIWVDAICINQGDDLEKTHQVNMMKDIYSNTANAILWLCEFSDVYALTRPPVVDPSPHRDSSLDQENVLPRETVAHAFGLIMTMAGGGHFCPRRNSGSEEIDYRRTHALSDLMNLSWWHRIWTVQEAVLPKRACIKCGSMQLDFSILLAANSSSVTHTMQECCRDLETIGSFWSTTSSLKYLKEKDPSPYLFVNSLYEFKPRLASDPRDKVFALLGLGGTTFPANYELPNYKDVISHLVRGLIAESKDIVILARTAERNRSPGLPTWAPDLCAELDSTRLHYVNQLARCYEYHHCNAAGGTQPETKDLGSESLLALQGLVVDEIVEIGRCFDDVDKTLETILEWRDIMNRAGELNHGIVYPRGGTYQEAFWRVMTVDFVLLRNGRRFDWRRANASDKAQWREEWGPNIKRALKQLLPSEGSWFFTTRTGMIGVCHSKVEVGDAVYVLLGGRMPFVLRPSRGHEEGTDPPRYEYVGQTYVHGIMDGEVIREGREPQWIALV
ncbi:heterokaryon incompatibility protein-domain-containing protein [Cercophora scortea]|uniref:Heterokaryon incompatibility protein-domain-containing protein n=1 Tax=Cercophora scortea TaxID=314031 RepID=A0AAE0I720_9PEZI|nr:heterokaryon incompatibility protein-domain-containing protein [Cercophora scortea]